MRVALILIGLMIGQWCLAQEQDTTVQEKRVKIAGYPAFGYSPETRFIFGGIGFFVIQPKVRDTTYHRPSSITPFVVFTSKKQTLIKSEFDLFFGKGLNLNLETRYFDFPDNYYGIGRNTDPDVVETYTDRFAAINGTFFKAFTPQWFGGLRFDFRYDEIVNIQEGGLLALDQPGGILGGRNMGMGPGFRFDNRNSTLWPTAGRSVNVGITFFGKALGGEYDYTSFLLDYRQYFELLGPKNILAIQFKLNMSAGGEVPFYKLNSIGGDNRLRGIVHSNVYRDRQAAYLQVEARQELFWRLGGVLFAGVGNVFGGADDFHFSDVRVVYGLGGRIRALEDEKLNFRMDLGFTDNGQYAVYFSVREAF